MCPLNEINAKDSGFLLNGELKIVVEVDVLETIGKVDVTEETSTITEIVDVNGFQLLPSHVRMLRIITIFVCRNVSHERYYMMCSMIWCLWKLLLYYAFYFFQNHRQNL